MIKTVYELCVFYCKWKVSQPDRQNPLEIRIILSFCILCILCMHLVQYKYRHRLHHRSFLSFNDAWWDYNEYFYAETITKGSNHFHSAREWPWIVNCMTQNIRTDHCESSLSNFTSKLEWCWYSIMTSLLKFEIRTSILEVDREWFVHTAGSLTVNDIATWWL